MRGKEDCVVGVRIDVIWAAYIVDLIVRLSLAPADARATFLRTHPSDVASAVLPVFRPFQLLRLLSRVRWFTGNSGDSVTHLSPSPADFSLWC
jgi:voltage-gated potassium channel